MLLLLDVVVVQIVAETDAADVDILDTCSTCSWAQFSCCVFSSWVDLLLLSDNAINGANYVNRSVASCYTRPVVVIRSLPIIVVAASRRCLRFSFKQIIIPTPANCLLETNNKEAGRYRRSESNYFVAAVLCVIRCTMNNSWTVYEWIN